MQAYYAGKIKYYRSTSLEIKGLYHAIFTRQGGVSPQPWRSLNFGSSVGDDVRRVQQNKVSALTALGIDLKSIYDVYQVHSTEIIFTDHPLHANETHLKADGIITDVPGITLLMRFADCVPILLYDPTHHAIGICHAGWLGTIHKIAERVVLEMHKHFKSDPGELTVVIGPSIGPDHYFVKPDVIEKVRASFGESSDMLSQREGKTYFDLWKANQLVLNDAGVYNIEVTGICTQCHVDDWYSHRGEHGSTGRFGIVIGLVA